MSDLDPLGQLETIRSLMERARAYRHPPAIVGVIAGLAANAAGFFTDRRLLPGDAESRNVVALAWGAAFLVAFVALVVFTSRAARREGIAFWSPLARDVVHALWPPLLVGVALTPSLAHANRYDLVAALWLLCYGAGGVAAGSFARPIVRALGVAFLAAGLLELAFAWPPGLVLAAGFGGLHLAYALAVALTKTTRG